MLLYIILKSLFAPFSLIESPSRVGYIFLFCIKIASCLELLCRCLFRCILCIHSLHYKYLIVTSSHSKMERFFSCSFVSCLAVVVLSTESSIGLEPDTLHVNETLRASAGLQSKATPLPSPIQCQCQVGM